MPVERPHAGQIIGAYRFESCLGVGGMGEVYKARDLRLARDVAVKVLPPGFTGDRDRLDRFRHEAQLLAALNHPNIATVHGLEESGSNLYLVMELIPGDTLAEIIARASPSNPLRLHDTLAICRQLAEALAAAHVKGITHRDIKPANVKVTPEGRVKVLDFGLARSMAGDRPGHDVDDAATVAGTLPGIVLGTPAYMSPEQVRGQPAGAAADVWSFGCVLFEMLSLRRAFAAASLADAIAAVLMTEPDWSALPPATPAAVRDLLARCFEKDQRRRLQPIEEARTILDGALQGRPAAGPEARAGAVRSIAVLPFVNASGDPQMEYLGDGLTESIIFSLSQLPGIRVAAQNTVFRYKGHTEPAQDIGRALGVDAVLTGRVLQRGETLRISAELVDVGRGWQIWGGQYRRSAGDILEAEGEITREISDSLRIRLSLEHEEILNRRRAHNVDAYHLYLKGRFHWAKRTEEGLSRCLQYFRQAIECDPTYALAWAGLAEGYIAQGFYSLAPSADAFPRARAAAERALEIDATLAEARTVIANVKAINDGDVEGAIGDLRLAIERNPAYPRAHQTLAECLTLQGRSAEAVLELKRALDLDPLSLYMNAAMVMTLYFARQYDAAVAHGRSAVDLDPDFYPLRMCLGWAYQQAGQLPEAITELEQARRLSGETTLTTASLGAALAAAGRTQEAREVLRRLDELSARRYVSRVFVAAIHEALGERADALSNLERAAADRCCWLQRCLRFDGRFDDLRGDPRARALYDR